MQSRRNLIAGLFATAGLGNSAEGATPPQASMTLGLLFMQQDQVLTFPPTGDGVRVGTASGRISGTTITNSQFQAVPPPEFKADDLVMLTDFDGDQIIFRASVTGRFLVPPLSEPDSAQGNLFGVGGPFAGTYEVIRANGKYEYLVGRRFPCKGIGSNPAKGGLLGTVYVEVYLDRFDDRPV